jgi:hypothetical protein
MRNRKWWKQNVDLANNAIFIGFMKPNHQIIKGCIFEGSSFAAQGILHYAKEAYKDVDNEVILKPTGKSIQVKGYTRYVIYLKKVKQEI